MYKVIKYFEDLQDNKHPYEVDDIFPREGLEVSEERFAELASKYNKQKEPLIVKVDEAEKGSNFADMKVDELKAYAAEKGIDLAGATKKADILAKIEEAEAAE